MMKLNGGMDILNIGLTRREFEEKRDEEQVSKMENSWHEGYDGA